MCQMTWIVSVHLIPHRSTSHRALVQCSNQMRRFVEIIRRSGFHPRSRSCGTNAGLNTRRPTSHSASRDDVGFSCSAALNMHLGSCAASRQARSCSLRTAPWSRRVRYDISLPLCSQFTTALKICGKLPNCFLFTKVLSVGDRFF